MLLTRLGTDSVNKKSLQRMYFENVARELGLTTPVVRGHCAKKKTTLNCLVDYEQEDFLFRGHSEDEAHSHPPIHGLEKKLAFSKEGKAKAFENKHSMPKVIFDHLMQKNGSQMRGPEMPNARAEKRKINRVRVKHLPQGPKPDEVNFSIPKKFHKGCFRE